MTVTISYAAVPTAFAALSSSDVTIKDTDKIPVQGIELICPVLFPDPSGWLDNVNFVRETMGVGGTGQYDISYDLKYIYIHAPVAGNISDLDNYNGMIAKLGIISSLIANNDTMGGVNDVTLAGISVPGGIDAPDGVAFQGAHLTLHVLQFV